MAPRRRNVNALGTDQSAANHRVPPISFPPTAPPVAPVVPEAPGVVPVAPAAQVLQSLLGLLNNHVAPQPAVPPTLSLDRGSLFERFMKAKPQEFHGIVDPIEAKAWVEIEKIFDVLGYSVDQKVAFAAFRFKGQAEHWWRMVKRQYEGRETELVWSKFLQLFNEKYFPEAVAIEEDRVMLFENGLQSEIYAKVAILEMKTYSALVSKALLAENGAEEEKRAEEQKAKEPQNKRLREERQVEHRGGGSNPSKKPYTQGQKQNNGKSGTTQGQTSRNRTQEKKSVATQGRVYTLTREEAEAAPSVVQGTLLISSVLAKVLFDSGSTHSFVAPKFLRCLSIPCEPLDACVVVSTPLGETLALEDVCRFCEIELDGRIFPVDLISLEMKDFNVILAMDWLMKHHASIDCFRKRVVFAMLGQHEFFFQGDGKGSSIEQRLEKLLVVREFVDVFPEELPGLPPDLSKDGVSVDSTKVTAIVDWPRPTSVMEVRSFLGLAGYYRRLMEGFSRIALSLTILTRKGVKFE
ncbi:uncharacterized protein LOC114283863 [Camellia sinensis]|uniref:uncharacterized protein LOC114283863 n=1 Tax=Camellia sinensis TaxID=4442 RepID=UPI001035768B|nr:uncharacterized protein LOC114283863 [Camellia sinensis]